MKEQQALANEWFKTLSPILKDELLHKYEGNVPPNRKEAIKFIYLNEASL